jgi:hypothetical protein
LPIRTHWLSEQDDLAEVLLKYGTERRPGDTVVISEKIALLLTGRTIPADPARVRPDARWLCRFVRPRTDALGLAHPIKMQWVLDTLGRPRVYAAAAAAALTRPFGIRGVFYRVAGPAARDIDGGRPPYEHVLFPPFDGAEGTSLCEELAAKLEVGVAIVDINDYGGTIRARSAGALPERTLLGVLADNPMRQRLSGTPLALVRPVL